MVSFEKRNTFNKFYAKLYTLALSFSISRSFSPLNVVCYRLSSPCAHKHTFVPHDVGVCLILISKCFNHCSFSFACARICEHNRLGFRAAFRFLIKATMHSVQYVVQRRVQQNQSHANKSSMKFVFINCAMLLLFYTIKIFILIYKRCQIDGIVM